MIIDFSHIMHLGMTVMTGGDAIGSLGGKDLIGLGLSIGPSLLLESGLQIPAAAAAAEIIGFIGRHIHKIFFTHHSPDHISKVFGHRIPKGFSYQLAGILNRKLDFQILVPV
jgi:hypothetical protein